MRICFAGVNPIDAKTRAGLGWAAAQNKDNPPRTPGYDVAGVVEKVGPGVTSRPRGSGVRHGGFPSPPVHMPNPWWPARRSWSSSMGVSLRQGAALPLAGLTAWQGLLEHGGLQSGQRVLILAGAGGVGHLAVQFAAAYGAHVVCHGKRRQSQLPSWSRGEPDGGLPPGRVVHQKRSPMVRSIWCWIWWGRERQGGAGLRQTGRPSGDGPPSRPSRSKDAGAELGVEVVGMLVHPDRTQLTQMLTLLRQGR